MSHLANQKQHNYWKLWRKRVWLQLKEKAEEQNISLSDWEHSGFKLHNLSITQGENHMIKILFLCHGRNCTFAWNALKSRLLGNENGICTPIVPLFCASVPRQPKSKAFGLEFVNRTVLDKNEYDLWWKTINWRRNLNNAGSCWMLSGMRTASTLYASWWRCRLMAALYWRLSSRRIIQAAIPWYEKDYKGVT